MEFSDIVFIRILCGLFLAQAVLFGTSYAEALVGAIVLIALLSLYVIAHKYPKRADVGEEISKIHQTIQETTKRMDEAEHNITALQFRGRA